jgi:DNA-binding transcriptional ArsR family regulator/predicted RNA-binding Zn-ribbon protein involved in translation (DUF1610 family)
MPRPRNSSPRSYELIWLALIDGEKTWTQLLGETGLHRDTLSRRLKYLVSQEMVKREKRGRLVYYSMVKYEPPYIGWEIRWIDHFMTKEDWDRKYEDIDIQIVQQQHEMRMEEKKREIVNRILDLPGNNELYEMLESKNMLGNVTVGQLRENYLTPYCLECIEKQKKLVKSKFIASEEKYVCPNCGIEITSDPRMRKMSKYEYFRDPHE